MTCRVERFFLPLAGANAGNKLRADVRGWLAALSPRQPFDIIIHIQTRDAVGMQAFRLLLLSSVSALTMFASVHGAHTERGRPHCTR